MQFLYTRCLLIEKFNKNVLPCRKHTLLFSSNLCSNINQFLECFMWSILQTSQYFGSALSKSFRAVDSRLFGSHVTFVGRRFSPREGYTYSPVFTFVLLPFLLLLLNVTIISSLCVEMRSSFKELIKYQWHQVYKITPSKKGLKEPLMIVFYMQGIWI